MSEKIVVGTDGSPTAKRAVAEAVRLAKALGGELHVVSAYDQTQGMALASAAAVVVTPVDDQEILDSTLSEAAASVEGVPVTTHPMRGDPADALVSVAEEVGASLIVVGNRGMHGMKRVLGSVPNSVSHRARCNVLIVATTD